MHPIEVAISAPVWRTFTYLCHITPAPGIRVRVPFGAQKIVGVVLGPAKEPPKHVTLKQVDEIIDSTPVYSKVLLDLARWLSSYYFHPLGETLKTMLPASGNKVKRSTIQLTEQGRIERNQGFSLEGRLLNRIFGKQRTSISIATAAKKIKTIDRSTEGQSSEFYGIGIDKLLGLGLIFHSQSTLSTSRQAHEKPTDVSSRVPADHLISPDAAPTLTSDQKAAFDLILKLGLEVDSPPSNPILLHGVTGSGKTEVYLRIISEVLARSNYKHQILVLVPEISLTPQMTRVFENRFPTKVSVVHSAMSDEARWEQLNEIRSGATQILIGPRSAIFGHFSHLKLIIVDEEHDSSYKQSSGLTYHGRDVAVVRGKMEGALVILGSATPSLESYHNALTGRYNLVELPNRVLGRTLPEMMAIPSNLKHSSGRNGFTVNEHHKGFAIQDAEMMVAPLIIEELRQNLERQHQAIVLVNRRGYASYLLGTKSQKVIQCPYCSISLTLHNRATLLRCHICNYSTNVAETIKNDPHETYAVFGAGSQKAEDYFSKELSQARITRIDSDSITKRHVLPNILRAFRKREIDILVGTQILAKGHDFPLVTLIVILEIDQILALPDFRSGERTFQLIVQAAGRAGRAEFQGKVLLQCRKIDHPVISLSIKQDYKAFAEFELKFRASHAYPPFTKMISFEFSSERESSLHKLSQSLENLLFQINCEFPSLISNIRILGPSTPPIEKIKKRFRRTLILTSNDVKALRTLASLIHERIHPLPRHIKMTIDVDPQSLL